MSKSECAQICKLRHDIERGCNGCKYDMKRSACSKIKKQFGVLPKDILTYSGRIYSDNYLIKRKLRRDQGEKRNGN